MMNITSNISFIHSNDLYTHSNNLFIQYLWLKWYISFVQTTLVVGLTNLWSMQKWYNKKGFKISSASVLILLFIVLFVMVSRNAIGTHEKSQSEMGILQISSEDTPTYVKFNSFQNSDSTWGFNIFVNSRPYLHYKNIPYTKAESGFQSRKDAEKVAGLFVRIIRQGDMNPELNRGALDSLGISMN